MGIAHDPWAQASFLFAATYPCMQQLHWPILVTCPLDLWRTRISSEIKAPLESALSPSCVPISTTVSHHLFHAIRPGSIRGIFVELEKLSALGALWVESKLLTKQKKQKKGYGNWLQNAFIMLPEIADSVEWNPQFSLISCFWCLNSVFPLVIKFTVHILNGLWYKVEATHQKIRQDSHFSKRREKKYRNATTTEFWYALYKMTNARFKHLLLPLMHDQSHF